MYYNTEEYSLTFNNLDLLEEEFIEYIVDYINIHPFIWNELTNRILYNQRITYVKDTTFIITTYEIKERYIKYFFELFKELLRMGYVNKIIYKKEFMIVHLYSECITKALSTPNDWIILMTYKLIKTKINYYDAFLNVTYESNSRKELLDLILCKDNIPKIIVNTKILKECYLSNIKKIWLYLFISRFDIVEDDWIKLKFNYNRTLFENELKSLIENNN